VGALLPYGGEPVSLETPAASEERAAEGGGTYAVVLLIKCVTGHSRMKIQA